MDFTSYIFGIFFCLIFLLYWKLPDKYRPILLLIANYIFYISFGFSYALVLTGIIFTSYIGALFIQSRNNKKVLLVFLLMLLLTILGIYKYSAFVVNIYNMLVGRLSLPTISVSSSLVAPIGISYYIFQAISYLIDVYRGKIVAEKNLLYYSVYLSFFPLILSGPIERAAHFLPQLYKNKSFNYTNAVIGLERLLWGYFKKLVIADNLAVYVNSIGNNISEYSGFVIILAAFGFTIQLYCDFSGYSDIAIGFAQMLGIHVNENFKSPYFSASIREFWSRWHVSLSSWLKDYIYIPLGGNRCTKIRSLFNIMITFLLSGFWHGAGIKYLIWGGMHGILQCVERLLPHPAEQIKITDPHLSPVQKIVLWSKIVFTFILLTFTWIPFWLPTTRSFIYAVSHMFEGITNFLLYIQTGIDNFIPNTYISTLLLIAFIILFIHDYLAVKSNTYDRVFIKRNKLTPIIRIFILLLILCCNCVAGKSFIYFQY